MIRFPTNFLRLTTTDTQTVYKTNSPWFIFFSAYLEYTLFLYTLFILLIWAWDQLFIPLPHELFTSFYNLLWAGVVFELIFKLFYVKSPFNYLRQEWFSLFIVLFPLLQPLRVFGISRFIILVLTKLSYSRFEFIRESRVLEILLISIVISILSADLFLLFEKDLPNSRFTNFSDALWFSAVTVATVGYGDVVPISTPGRILATLLIIFGFSVFGLITATISSYLITRKMKPSESLHLLDNPLLGMGFAHSNKEVVEKIDKLSAQITALEEELHKKKNK